MRSLFPSCAFLPLLFALTPLASAPASAQSDTPSVQVRVDRLEKEMKAVQRKVFPGGTPIEPDITRAPAPAVVPGTPASTPVSDLIARVDALEGQLASLTGQVEQNSFKLKQLEDGFAKYKAETDAKLATAASPPPAVAPTQGTTAKPTTAKPTSAAAGTTTAAATPAAAAARKAAVAAIELPDTGDFAMDAYTYGYRLWDAKFYPEAQTQLKATLDKFGTAPVASRTANLLGRAYLDDGKPALASVAFYENYQKRPKGDRAADSLTWLGEALIQLKKPADACKVYSELEQVYGATLNATLRAMMTKGRERAKCA
ncbi:tetratricopeptide repeat protein [Sphingobium algorifonticola]|uniref:Tetratricopeptide repeat protein n=1 Tax=Sphingobium algorifonticola TaxID=2008318 RepID=A0A437J8D3_9SPHN|nr:tetratricopeptide repeat protein [Sphingobium algorifonticola]RVT41766.1 tetratricopeptide repeat protein [Sphingobium algorifonticola]